MATFNSERGPLRLPKKETEADAMRQMSMPLSDKINVDDSEKRDDDVNKKV
jgi:predicted small lipoprotein YifL